MNIDGIRLTPRVLFWAYKATCAMAIEALNMIAVVQSSEKHQKYTRSYLYHLRLAEKIAKRLDCILKEMEE